MRSLDRQIAQASELSFPVVFHTENCAIHSGNPTVSCGAIKQQTRALFLSTTVTRTRRHTEVTKKKKTDKPGGKPVLCQRTFSSVFRAVFYTVKPHSLA